jgi:hypothetical protein
MYSSYVYKKGDLISIKQDVMMLSYQKNGKRAFNTTKKLENAIFLGVAKDDVSTREIYEYCLKYTPIKNPCMVAIGDQTFYVDESHFFFYNRRNNEKIDRSYAK